MLAIESMVNGKLGLELLGARVLSERVMDGMHLPIPDTAVGWWTTAKVPSSPNVDDQHTDLRLPLSLVQESRETVWRLGFLPKYTPKLPVYR